MVLLDKDVSRSSPLERADDLNLVAGRERGDRPLGAAHDGAVDRDGEKAGLGVDAALAEQLGDRRHRHLRLDPVDAQPHHSASAALAGCPTRAASRGEALGRERTGDLGQRSGQYIGADHRGADRGQQNAVAMMAGGDDQPVDAARSQHRRIVARARPEPDPHLGDRQFLDRRDRAPGALDQREHPARGEALIEPALFDRGADDQPAVTARHQIAARQPHHMAQQRRRRVHLQGQHLPLDRAHRRQIGRRNAADLARPGAGRQHDDIGRIAAALGDDAGGAAAGTDDLADRAMLDELDPGAAGGRCQRAAELAVLDLVVARAPHGGGDAGLQMRLLLARLGRRQPGEVEAEPFLELVGMAQLGGVVAIERDDDAFPRRGIRPRRPRRSPARARNPATGAGFRAPAAAAAPRRARSRPRPRACRPPPSWRRARPRRGRTPSPRSRPAPAARRCPGR